MHCLPLEIECFGKRGPLRRLAFKLLRKEGTWGGQLGVFPAPSALQLTRVPIALPAAGSRRASQAGVLSLALGFTSLS